MGRDDQLCGTEPLGVFARPTSLIARTWPQRWLSGPKVGRCSDLDPDDYPDRDREGWQSGQMRGS